MNSQSLIEREGNPLTLATWNVRTLANKRDMAEENFIGKLHILECQFKEAGLDIIALQETRVPGCNPDYSHIGKCYQSFFSGTQVGELGRGERRAGVGLLIKKELMSPEVVWHPINERIAWMEGRWSGNHLAIIVVYAPTLPKAGDYDIGETARFYSKLSEVIRALPARMSRSYIVLGDLNARVGHCNGNQDLVRVLGDELDSSELNLNGEALIQFCLQSNSTIINSMRDHVQQHGKVLREINHFRPYHYSLGIKAKGGNMWCKTGF